MGPDKNERCDLAERLLDRAIQARKAHKDHEEQTAFDIMLARKLRDAFARGKAEGRIPVDADIDNIPETKRSAE